MVRTIYLLSQQANKWDLFNLKSVIIKSISYWSASEQFCLTWLSQMVRTIYFFESDSTKICLPWFKSVIIMVRTIYFLSQQADKWDLFTLKSDSSWWEQFTYWVSKRTSEICLFGNWWTIYSVNLIICLLRTIYFLSQQANKWDLFTLKSVIIMVRTIYLLSQQAEVRFV